MGWWRQCCADRCNSERPTVAETCSLCVQSGQTREPAGALKEWLMGRWSSSVEDEREGLTSASTAPPRPLCHMTVQHHGGGGANKFQLTQKQQFVLANTARYQLLSFECEAGDLWVPVCQRHRPHGDVPIHPHHAHATVTRHLSHTQSPLLSPWSKPVCLQFLSAEVPHLSSVVYHQGEGLASMTQQFSSSRLHRMGSRDGFIFPAPLQHNL